MGPASLDSKGRTAESWAKAPSDNHRQASQSPKGNVLLPCPISGVQGCPGRRRARSDDRHHDRACYRTLACCGDEGAGGEMEGSGMDGAEVDRLRAA